MLSSKRWICKYLWLRQKSNLPSLQTCHADACLRFPNLGDRSVCTEGVAKLHVEVFMVRLHLGQLSAIATVAGHVFFEKWEFLPGYVKVQHGTSGFHVVEQSILTCTCLTNEINVACVELHGLTCLTVFDILPTAASGTCCQATPFAWVTIASTPTIKWLHHLTLCASSDISRIGTVDQEWLMDNCETYWFAIGIAILLSTRQHESKNPVQCHGVANSYPC